MNYEELLKSRKNWLGTGFILDCTQAYLRREVTSYEYKKLITRAVPTRRFGGQSIGISEMEDILYAVRDYVEERFRKLEDKEKDLGALLERAKRRLDESEKLLENIDKHYLTQSGDVKL